MCEDDAQPPVMPYHTGTNDQQQVPPKYYKYDTLLYNPVTRYTGPGQRVARVFRPR